MTAERYEATVPDTLDLAERAALSVNSITGAADIERNYESYHVVHLDQNPPYYNHRTGGPCWPKQLHPLPMMRIMSGSTQNAGYDARMMQALLATIGDDGLMWMKMEGRPWDVMYKEDYICTGSQSRFIVALTDWHKYDGDARWLEVAGHLARGLARIAIRNEDRAWYYYELYRSGWRVSNWQREPEKVSDCRRLYYAIGQPLYAFSRWYKVSGSKDALDMAHRLARFFLRVRKEENCPDWPTMITGREHGLWAGHFHESVRGMLGMAEYAIITNNAETKSIVQGFYEYARLHGISRMGFFPGVVGPLAGMKELVLNSYGQPAGMNDEACGIGEMTCLAVMLSEAGIGDYWDDVDQYVRNHLVEHQLIRRDLLQEIRAAGPNHKLDPSMQTEENVAERALGGFSSISDPAWTYAWYTMCCNTNAPMGLYAAWQGIIHPADGDTVQINLLLNRASAWMDIDSYLPYEGKVVLTNKTAKRAFVRLPRWVDKTDVRCRVNQQPVTSSWLNNYMVIDGLAPRDVITLKFPMVETVEKWSDLSYGKEYTCHFKGNTLVDISPRGDGPMRSMDAADDGDKTTVNKGYPLYQRDHYKAYKAPLKKVNRYVAPRLI